MAVVIEKPAPKFYRVRCGKCGATYRYELSDVSGAGFTYCPTCGTPSYHIPAREGE